MSTLAKRTNRSTKLAGSVQPPSTIRLIDHEHQGARATRQDVMHDATDARRPTARPLFLFLDRLAVCCGLGGPRLGGETCLQIEHRLFSRRARGGWWVVTGRVFLSFHPSSEIFWFLWLSVEMPPPGRIRGQSSVALMVVGWRGGDEWVVGCQPGQSGALLPQSQPAKGGRRKGREWLGLPTGAPGRASQVLGFGAGAFWESAIVDGHGR